MDASISTKVISMLTIRGIHPINGGRWVLYCDIFGDEIVTDKLSVNGIVYGKDKFQVEKPRACFNSPNSRCIVLSTKQNCQNIQALSFV